MSESPAALSTDELLAKVERGVAWLTEHDQEGFHFHYVASQGPGLPLKFPRQWDADKIRAYREYASARKYFDELYALLEKRGEQEVAS